MDNADRKDTYTSLRYEDSRKGKLLLLSLVVGLLAGSLSSLFRFILAQIATLRETLMQAGYEVNLLNMLILVVLAALFIYISLYLVRKFAPETSGSGIQEIEGTLDGTRELNWKRVIPVKFFASIFSLGSGLLLGREGPTVQLGAGIGKMVKDVSKYPDEGNNPLISAGSAAGLASAFNAPLSGIVFVIEEMNGHFIFNFYNLASIMIGAGTADLMVRLLLGPGLSLPLGIFSGIEMSFHWLFPLLGILIGILGFAYNHMIIFCLDLFKKFKKHLITTSVILSILLVIAAYYSSDFVGAGYYTIHHTMSSNYSLQFLLLLLLGRFILSVLSYGSGVPGGLFAPLLTVGVLFGMVFGMLTQILFPELTFDPGIFAIAGMAALFASTVRAPLTGLALAVEMTANYDLILPLILTTVTASVVTTMLGNKPIYTTLLARILKAKD
jgi:CIC family chloride channel protein